MVSADKRLPQGWALPSVPSRPTLPGVANPGHLSGSTSPNGSCKITLSGDLSLDVFSLYFLERCRRSKVSIYTQLQAACQEIPSTRQGGNLQSVLWFLIAERRRSMMQFTMRTLAMITGLIGVVVAFVINILYSTFHVLGRVTGITSNQSHFFFGLLVILIGFIGSLMGLFTPIVGAVLLVASGRGVFFHCWLLRAPSFPLLSFSRRLAHPYT